MRNEDPNNPYNKTNEMVHKIVISIIMISILKTFL